MTMKEQWSFSKILVHPAEGPLSNVIVDVEYTYAMSDGRRWQQQNGKTTLNSPAPGPDFIDYQDISFDQMVDFTKAGLGSEFDTMQAELTEALANPVVPMPLPWEATQAVDDWRADDDEEI